MLLPWSLFGSRSSKSARRAKSAARKRPPRSAARKIEVECLESRIVPATYHVDITASGPELVNDINNPFHTIQKALKTAAADNVADTIIVYGNNTGNPDNVYVWTRDGDADNNLVPDRNMFVDGLDTLIFRSRTRITNVLAPVFVKLQNNIIDIEGQLRVEGETGFPVVITSLQADTAGGDT